MWRNIALDMCFYNIIVIDKKCETKLVAEDLIYKNTWPLQVVGMELRWWRKILLDKD